LVDMSGLQRAAILVSCNIAGEQSADFRRRSLSM
jgi:hypothetical protein